MPKHDSLLDYSDIQSVRFCSCGCPIEVKTSTATIIPFVFNTSVLREDKSHYHQSMPACPFCYRVDEFGLPGDQLLPLPLLLAKTQARILAEGLRIEGIWGANGRWERGESDLPP